MKPQWWKIYVVVFKFVLMLKRRRRLLHSISTPVASARALIPGGKHEMNETNLTKPISNPHSWRLFKKSTAKVAPLTQNEKKTVETESTLHCQQSITRQLAFGHAQMPNQMGKAKKVEEFYNSPWANLLAKICTVVVLLVTILLIIIFLTRGQ